MTQTSPQDDNTTADPSGSGARAPASKPSTPEDSKKDGEDAARQDRAKAQAAESSNEDG